MSEDAGKPTTLLPEGHRPGLFEAYGVEIETMIVDAASLDVQARCDELIAAVAGEAASEIELGDIAWSNELTLHVLELKTNGPAPSLEGLSERFHESARLAVRHLRSMGCRLMPGAMHPWMDPTTETELWPHEYTDVYRTFDRIFGCSGHGWANLQSTHLNLPFADDEEFGRLHAAIRLVLPLIPALCASSPFQDGRVTGLADSRLAAYRGNARRVPSVTGLVIPEPAFSMGQYEREILGSIYRDLEPHDPEGVLRYEWANARGAIARFDRGAIEIRIVDAQECPAADLAVLATIVALVRALTEGTLGERDPRADPSTERLAAVLGATIGDAERALLDDDELRAVLGLRTGPTTAHDAWRRLVDRHPPQGLSSTESQVLETILSDGPLARRMLAAAGADPRGTDLRRVAGDLCTCLESNERYLGGS